MIAATTVIPKRCAIVGTAETWRLTPWNDPGLRIVGLNDAYVLGFPRADEWFELHPLDKMMFRPREQKVIRAEDVPPGYYIRPNGHIEWLKAQAATINVWLQKEPPSDWPANASRLPLESLEAKYGTYWASGPAYELMHLYERGYREFQIYGIHLATDHERIQQRHNFEYLIGRLLGPEVTQRVDGERRIYEGRDVRVVLPVKSPILQHDWKYAYEPKPERTKGPYDDEWHAVQKEKKALIKALVNWPSGKDKSVQLERLSRLEVIEFDIQQQTQLKQLCGTIAIEVLQPVPIGAPHVQN